MSADQIFCRELENGLLRAREHLDAGFAEVLEVCDRLAVGLKSSLASDLAELHCITKSHIEELWTEIATKSDQKK